MWFERFVIICTSLARDFLALELGLLHADALRLHDPGRQLRPVLHAVPAVLPLPADGGDGRSEGLPAPPAHAAITDGCTRGLRSRARAHDTPSTNRRRARRSARPARRVRHARASSQAAAKKVRDAGYQQAGTPSRPSRSTASSAAMGIKMTMLPWIVLGAGLTGLRHRHPGCSGGRTPSTTRGSSAASRSGASRPTCRSCSS